MNTMKRIAQVLVSVSVCTVATAVLADAKNIPGSICSAASPDTGNVGINTGGIEMEAASGTVYCPLVRDVDTISSVTVYFDDVVNRGVPGGGVTCTLYARDVLDPGSSWDSTEEFIEYQSNDAGEFDLVGFTDGTVATRTYTMTCDMITGDQLSAIHYDE